METHLIEYKQSWADEYLEWVCGYANADGGTLYIGKDDAGNTVGVKNAKKLSEDIPNKIKSSMGIVPSVSLLKENDLWYVEIEVPPVHQVITYRGKVFYRSGATKQTLDGPALTNFIMNRFNMSFDSLTIDGLSIDDFDNDAFRAFKDEAIHNNRMFPEDRGLSKLELMEKLHLIKDGKITYAGMLMFYQDPERYIPACYTKVGYFKDGSDLRYMDDIHGPLVKQAMQTIEILYAKYFRSYEEFSGVRRITHYQYPRDVVREAVCNAIIHRNYSQCNMVQIKVFPDKVMMFNNCIFPNGWTVDNLLKPHESKAINPLIAYAFYVMGYIDTWGRGIDKIVNGLKHAGQEEPVFEETKYSFCLSMKPLFIDEPTIATENGTDNGTKNGTDNGTDKVIDAENGTDNGTDGLIGTDNGTDNDTESLVDTENGTDNGTDNNVKGDTEVLVETEKTILSAKQKAVLCELKKNPSATYHDIAMALKLGRTTVYRAVKSLCEQGIVKRVGPDIKGYWEIISDEE